MNTNPKYWERYFETQPFHKKVRFYLFMTVFAAILSVWCVKEWLTDLFWDNED